MRATIARRIKLVVVETTHQGINRKTRILEAILYPSETTWKDELKVSEVERIYLSYNPLSGELEVCREVARTRRAKEQYVLGTRLKPITQYVTGTSMVTLKGRRFHPVGSN